MMQIELDVHHTPIPMARETQDLVGAVGSISRPYVADRWQGTKIVSPRFSIETKSDVSSSVA